jgi:hypothetical protein
MMIRINNRYLDFSGTVEMERQSKLFEEIDKTRGDFSYQSSIPTTHNNLDILGLPFPDNASKIVYTNVDCDLISNTGEVLYSGYLRVEGLNKREIRFRVFSGNSNWMNSLTGSMTDLDLSAYDQTLSNTNIRSRQTATSGITFPVIDTGALITRGYFHLKREDFVGTMYLRTLFKETFRQSGLKLAGELLTDPIYNSIVLASNARSKIDIDANSIYVGKNVSQAVLGTGDITNFNLQSAPYTIGSDVTFNSNYQYVANYEMIVDIDLFVISDAVISTTIGINGTPQSKVTGTATTSGSNSHFKLPLRNVHLDAGDIVDAMTFLSAAGNITYASLKITPRFIYHVFGRSSVPLWSKQDFVSNVLALFNTVSDYDPYSKTVTINLFKNLKGKEPVDLSQYIQVQDTDYADFISSYGRSSNLSYAEGDAEDLREYNISSYYRYGGGSIQVNNDFIQESADIVSSDFTTPTSYIHPRLDASIERINFVELEEKEDAEITSVTDNAGVPRFNVDADEFEEDDLVRIESDQLAYNGDFVVSAVGAGWVEVWGLAYESDATGTIKRMVHNLTTDDSVYLLINTVSRSVPDFSNLATTYYLGQSSYTTWTLAFFSLINNDTTINDIFKQSLSFGAIEDPGFYQRTMLEAYWKDVEAILNDPVKLICEGKVPETVFRSLTPLRPVYLTTQETTNRYYINKISGYIEAKYPFRIELIKLP